MNIEFSFTAFDDFPALKDSKSKVLVSTAGEVLRNNGIPVVYSQIIRMAALDASISVKNMHRGLADRIQTFPNKRQVLIHFFDNLCGPQYLFQDRGRNEASFTTDVRNFRPFKQAINEKSGISHTLTTAINVTSLVSSLSSFNCLILDHEKLYLDNYIYYLSLLYSQNSGVSVLLVYIPHEIDSADLSLHFLIKLCEGISNNLC